MPKYNRKITFLLDTYSGLRVDSANYPGRYTKEDAKRLVAAANERKPSMQYEVVKEEK